MSSTKHWSLYYTRSIVLALFAILAVLVMSLLMVSAGLRCVDRDGCIREFCASPDIAERFHPEYIRVMQESIQNNPKCRINLFGNSIS
jgi:hypothetical protein